MAATPHEAGPPDGGQTPLHLRRIAPSYLTEAADAGSLYAVVDGCAVPAISDLARTLGPERAACLYLGDAAANYGDKAPYLLRVDSALAATLGDGASGPAWGCFVVSSSGFEAVRRHLRGWLTVNSPEGEAWLFRFWDPRLLPIFLRASLPDELNAFFGPIDAFAVIDPVGSAFAAWRDTATIAVAPRRPVGDRHAISRAQLAALRRSALGDGLVATFTAPLSAHRDPDTGDVLVRAPDDGVIRLHSGQDGAISGVTSPMGRHWSMDHREDGKLVRLVTPSGLDLTVEHDSAGHVARVVRDGAERFQAIHDLHGRVQRIDFPDGTAAHTAYALEGRAALADTAGDLVSARRDRLGQVERFAYDGDRLTAAVDGAGNATQFLYETARRPDATVFADGRHETYDYDPAGHLMRLVRTDGTALNIRCNDQGRPLRIAAADGGESTFAYDDAGRLVAARNDLCAQAWRYDEAGRLVEERRMETGQDEVVVGYQHDASGLVGLTYPTGETVRFARDLDQRLVEIRDWSGQSYRIDHGEHDAAWRMTGPDGVVSTAWQSRVGLTTAVKVEAAGATLWETAYAYDDEDRLRERRDSHLGPVAHDYDAESQLTGVTRGSGVERFAYDAAGNRTSSAAGPATFDPLNRMLSQGSQRFAYNDRGAMIERSGPEGTWRFEYDAFDRLVAAEDNWGRRLTFGYDPLGRRLWKRSVAGPVETLTRFVWAGEQVIRETTEINGQDQVWDTADSARPGTRDYLYWPQTSTPLLLRERGTVYRYHTEPSGVPTRLTAPGGRTVWEAELEAFGLARVRVAEVAQPWRLPGQYADDEFGLGLHYNRFRYYDPAIGRYISRDPVGVAGGLNLYLYVGNDPINRNDPLGLFWGTVGLVVAAVAVVVAVAVLAPALLPVLAVGALVGAVVGGIVEGVTQETFCLDCILLASLRGAAIGVIGSVPFLFVGPAAGLGAFAAAGAAGGFISYAADVWSSGAAWSWKAALFATGLGLVLGALGKYVTGKLAARKSVASAPEEPVVATPKAAVASADGVSPNGGSTYSQRLAQTPVSNGSWTGARGESTFVSTHPDVVPILGKNGIGYKNAYPDFSPTSAGKVEIPNMTTSRSSNFAQADKALAEQLGKTPSEIKNWRIENKYTWHEVQDLKTMHLVPTPVNAKFGHMGGVGEINAGMTKP
jgi:RHS repeat-associated protein